MMMNRKFTYTLFGLFFALMTLPGAAFAGTMILNSFTDQTTEPINLPATKLLMASVGTATAQGGNDATATSVTIAGTVVAADIAEVCVDYAATQVVCVTNPGSLSNISLTLSGTQKGGAAFDYRVTLNPSAASKTIQLTVNSITNTNLTDNIPLPRSTATRNIAGASTPPAITTPTFASVLTNGATLGGNITSLGTSPTASQHGTVWNYTGNPTTANNPSTLGTPSLGAFTDARTGMQTADQVFFKAYVSQGSTPYYTAESSFHTYPANDPSGFSIDQVTASSMRINWTDSSETGDAGGSIVIVSLVDSTITAPADGAEYTGDASYPFSVTSGTNDFVVFRGRGSSNVSLTSLPENTQFWVAIYAYSGTGTGTPGVRYKATTAATGTQTTLATPPVVGNPTFSAVLTNGATLGIDSVTGNGIDAKGTAWNYTTGVTEANNPLSFGTGPGAFSHARTGMNSADQIFFKGYAHNSGGYSLTSEASFYTYPANDPTGFSIDQVTANSMRINWTDSSETGDARQSAVVISTDASFVHPVDGTDYTPDPSAPFDGAAQIGGSGDYVVYKGTGGTVTVTGLSPSTQYWFRVYSSAGSGAGASGVRYKTDGTPAAGSDTTLTGPPVVGNPTFSAVSANGATLGIDDVTGSGIDDKGTAWNYTTGVTEANNPLSFGSGPGAFSHARTGMNSADRIFFKGYAHNSAGYSLTTEASFHTYPANDPSGLNFTATDHANITINWTPSTETGDAAGSIVVVSTANDGFTVPVDGTDYTPNAVYPFSSLGGNDYVVYKGAGGSVTISNLPELTTFYVAVYSAAGLGTSGVSGVRYKTPTTATGNQTTTAAPAVPVVALDTPAFDTVTSSGARLRAIITDLGNPAASQYGTVWNYTGNPTNANNASALGAPATGPFTDTRIGMNSADQVFFKAYAYQNPTYYYSGEASFYTYPKNDPTNLTFLDTQVNSILVGWTPSAGETGDARQSVVVISTDAIFVHPVDGIDYTPDASAPFSGTAQIGSSGDYVVYKGTNSAVTVTGLSPSTQYWFRVYSSAGSGAGISGVRYKTNGTPASGNDTTASGVSQATNLWFHNIGSTGMTLFWDEGIGDGSIVIMKEGSAVSATPSNGTEHVANSVFGSGANLDGSNYVVYRGTGESVHVTGLTQGLTYHVAVHTYTGAGALIEYLLPSPAVGNETTTANTPHNVAVLNIDSTVGCTTGCHGFHNSTLVPRGAEQETMCVTCHNPAGFPGALDKLNFSLHTNSKSMPPLSPGVVDCGSCHELHNPSGDDTTYTQHPLTSLWANNLYYLRANPQKYVPSALPWPANNLVVHADANSEDWAFENGAGYEGACQICHTLTSHYRNSAFDNIHQGGDLGNVNCKGCHDHGGSFAGAGGDCTACHNQVQDKDGAGGTPGRRIVTTEFSGGAIVSSHLPGTLNAADCEVCHDQSSHQAGQVKLKDPDGGTSISIASYVDPRTSSTEAAKLTSFCVACHDSNGAVGDTTPFTTGNTAVNISTDWTNASHNTTGSVSCFGDGAFGCHGSGHGGQKLTLLAPAETGPGTNNSDEREQFCFNCHDGNPGINIWTFFSSPRLTVTSASGAAVSNRHDVLPTEQTNGGVVTCNDCHLPHKNNNANPVADPDNDALLPAYSISNSYTEDGHNFTYNSGGNLSPLNPEGCAQTTGCTPTTEPDYIKFCLTCHDGTTPPGVTMTPNMINIATAWAGVDKHGRLDGSTGSRTSKGGLKKPWVNNTADAANDDPTAPYAAQNCSICHGAHGGPNLFNLKSSITVAGAVMTVGGVGNMNEAAYSGSTTYTLPLIGGVQTDHYWGAWCTFCHKMDAHPGKVQADACTGAHMHGGGSF